MPTAEVGVVLDLNASSQPEACPVPPCLNVTTSNLRIQVAWDTGDPVLDAAVLVWIPAAVDRRNGFTDENGLAEFQNLPFGQTAQVNVSLGNILFSTNVVLGMADVVLPVILESPKALVRLRAVDFSNENRAIQNARFMAFELHSGEVPGDTECPVRTAAGLCRNAIASSPSSAPFPGGIQLSCAVQAPGDNCVLRLPFDREFVIVASAQGFISELQSIQTNADELNVLFRLVNQSLPFLSQVKDFKVTMENSNDEVSVLYAGKTYEAKFTLLANTSSAND
ncbi:MAG TPA: hypothetical protein VJI67_03870, partial [archaeon]|nr:hypothetical protein [archaeon]